MRSRHVIGIALVFSVVCARGADGQPACAVSDDAAYAFTKEKPVQVGGMPMFGASRQRRYLDTLRGPDGQPIRYTRAGAVEVGDWLVDAYQVTYDGLERPITLYLDWYHFTEPRAPKGFACAQPINLGLPPPDMMMAREQLDALALIDGAAAESDPSPIQLGEPKVAAIVFDQFRLLARAARQAAAANKPLDARRLPREFTTPRTLVIAPPMPCEDTAIPAVAVELIDPRGNALRPQDSLSKVADIAPLTPGFEVVPDSMATVFAIDRLQPGLTIQIGYRDGCSGGAADVKLPVTFTPPRLTALPMPVRPANESSPVSWIALQVVIDPAGMFREARPLGGPDTLTRPAVDALKLWRADPARINGAATPLPVVVQVTFRSEKEP